jgi:hypothetical protein
VRLGAAVLHAFGHRVPLISINILSKHPAIALERERDKPWNTDEIFAGGPISSLHAPQRNCHRGLARVTRHRAENASPLEKIETSSATYCSSVFFQADAIYRLRFKCFEKLPAITDRNFSIHGPTLFIIRRCTCKNVGPIRVHAPPALP